MPVPRVHKNVTREDLTRAQGSGDPWVSHAASMGAIRGACRYAWCRFRARWDRCNTTCDSTAIAFGAHFTREKARFRDFRIEARHLEKAARMRTMHAISAISA